MIISLQSASKHDPGSKYVHEYYGTIMTALILLSNCSRVSSIEFTHEIIHAYLYLNWTPLCR